MIFKIYTHKFTFTFLVRNWFRYARDTTASPMESDKLDLPESATKWLKYIKQLNNVSLSQLDVSNK